MPLRKSHLYSSLWQSCDQLRGGVDASQYKEGQRTQTATGQAPNERLALSRYKHAVRRFAHGSAEIVNCA